MEWDGALQHNLIVSISELLVTTKSAFDTKVIVFLFSITSLIFPSFQSYLTIFPPLFSPSIAVVTHWYNNLHLKKWYIYVHCTGDIIYIQTKTLPELLTKIITTGKSAFSRISTIYLPPSLYCVTCV